MYRDPVLIQSQRIIHPLTHIIISKQPLKFLFLEENFFFQFSSKKAKPNSIPIIPNDTLHFYLSTDIKFPNIYQILQSQQLI